MATLRQLKDEAAKHGAELVIDREFNRAEAWLSESKQWDASGASCIVVDFGWPNAGVLPDIYDALIEDMQAGSKK